MNAQQPISPHLPGYFRSFFLMTSPHSFAFDMTLSSCKPSFFVYVIITDNSPGFPHKGSINRLQPVFIPSLSNLCYGTHTHAHTAMGQVSPARYNASFIILLYQYRDVRLTICHFGSMFTRLNDSCRSPDKLDNLHPCMKTTFLYFSLI